MPTRQGFQRGSGVFTVEFGLFHPCPDAMKGEGHLRRRVQHPRGQVYRADVVGVLRRSHLHEGVVDGPGFRVERIPERERLLVGVGHAPDPFGGFAMEHESRLTGAAQVFTLAPGQPGQRRGQGLVVNAIELGGKCGRILGHGNGLRFPRDRSAIQHTVEIEFAQVDARRPLVAVAPAAHEVAHSALAGRLSRERFHVAERRRADRIQVVPIPQARQRRKGQPASLERRQSRIRVARRIIPEHGHDVFGQQLQNAGMVQDDVGVHHHGLAL